MNSSTENSHSNRTVLLRSAIIVLCIFLGLAGVLAHKHFSALNPAPEAQASPTAPVVPVKLSAEEIFATIPTREGNSDTDKALATFLEKLRKSPNDAFLWVHLGDALAQKMRDTSDEKYYDSAELAYQRGLDLKSDSIDAMTGLAWVNGGRHLFDRSVEWANRALALDPENAAANGISGDAALELGDYEAAFDRYQKMMDSKPDLSSWSRGAYLLWLTGNPTKGTWLMQKAIESGAPFAENTAWCRAKYADMLYHNGAFLPAAQALVPALKAAPKNTQVLLSAGRIAAAQLDYAAAERYYQTILESGPQHEALVALGDLQMVKKDPVAAEKYYVQVEELYQKHLNTANHSHLNVAKFYADHDRNLVEALRITEQNKLTKNVISADTLAWVYYKNGDQPRAIEAIKIALAQKTPDAEIHYHAAMIAARFGDKASALNHLRIAVGLNPQFNVLGAPIAAATLQKLSTGQNTASLPETETRQP